MILDYSNSKHLIDNFYDLLVNNNLKVTNKTQNASYYQDELGNELRFRVENRHRESIHIVCSLVIRVPTVKRYEASSKKAKRIMRPDLKMELTTSTQVFDLFSLQSSISDIKTFLDTISNQLKNQDNIDKMTPFLDFIAIKYNLHSFCSYFHGVNIDDNSGIQQTIQEKFFHVLYKNLFGSIHYIWDANKNNIIDNYHSRPIHIEPLEYTFHEVLDSQAHFEEYIANKPKIIEYYRQIEL